MSIFTFAITRPTSQALGSAVGRARRVPSRTILCGLTSLAGRGTLTRRRFVGRTVPAGRDPAERNRAEHSLMLARAGSAQLLAPARRRLQRHLREEMR